MTTSKDSNLRRRSTFGVLVIMTTVTVCGMPVTASEGPTTSTGTKPADALPQSSHQKTETGKSKSKLKDGLYLILRQDPDRAKVEPAAPDEEIVINDFEFLQPSEREPTSFIAVSQEQFIPFIFSTDPAKGSDDKGRTKLLLQLAEDQIKPLESFTEKHCGKSVAIIIGGKVVTTHKIREAITGGKLQITRCSDFGCDVLYTQLLKDSKH